MGLNKIISRVVTVVREVEEEGLAGPEPVCLPAFVESPQSHAQGEQDCRASTDLIAKIKPDKSPMFDPSTRKSGLEPKYSLFVLLELSTLNNLCSVLGRHMKKCGNYYVTVVEDATLGQMVATATLVPEHKFIHSCAKRGRVDVSDECRRRKQVGKLLLSALTLLSKKLDCYKFTLECLTQNVGFHKNFGYTVSEEKLTSINIGLKKTL
uniref:Glucosamine 6-phosphate N-acetyltransferase n=1 Tax=Rhinolophus ferrumequinum TaxID=59479 RepID=A0A671EDP4_RHIFE